MDLPVVILLHKSDADDGDEGDDRNSLFEQHEFLCLRKSMRLHPTKIDTRRQIGRIPGNGMRTRWNYSVDK
jgi:hypothetical protein